MGKGKGGGFFIGVWVGGGRRFGGDGFFCVPEVGLVETPCEIEGGLWT